MRPWIPSCAALALLALAGCGGASESPAETTGGAQSAAPPADVVSSITNRQLDYRFYPAVLEEPALAFAGLLQSTTNPGEVVVKTSLFRLVPSSYTLTATADSGDTNDAPADMPARTVKDGVPRLVLFVSQDGFRELASAEGVTLFEKLVIEDDGASYETVLASGERVTGRVELPGLVAGSTQYGVAVLPRNVPSGSIFGTHFFKVKVACKTSDCAMAAHRR